MQGNIMLLLLVLWPMAGALFTYLIGKKKSTFGELGMMITVFINQLFMIAVTCLWISHGTMAIKISAICLEGINFKLDGFRVVYGNIVNLSWLTAAFFSRDFLQKDTKAGRFYVSMLLTLGTVMGIFLSADFYTIFLFFEMMSFISYEWVAHKENEKALRAAGTYLAIAVIGGLVSLLGIFMLYHLTGTLDFDALLQASGGVEQRRLLYAAGACILFGLSAKAGMFPLHFWLPKSYREAPAPATALLSGILSKAGLFGMIAVTVTIFREDTNWGMLLLLSGTITMVLGGIFAVFSKDMKEILAYSSMSQIGFIIIGLAMTCLLGRENAIAIQGTVLHMVNHSFLKLLLFLAAGVVFMDRQSTDLNVIRGYGKKKPVFHFLFLSGALGIGGIPLWNGYISKTLLHESIVSCIHITENKQFVNFFQAVEWSFLFAGGLTVAYMLKIYIALFIEKNRELPKRETGKEGRIAQNNLEGCGSEAGIRGVTKYLLTGIALLLPVMGMVPQWIMIPIGKASEAFLRGTASEIQPAAFFTLLNMKGAFISITIGIFFYVIVIRKLMMGRDDKGVLVYRNPWPRWLSMEELVYRPLFLSILPNIFAFFCRILDYMVDAFVALLRMTVYRDVKEFKEPVVGTRFTQVLGTIFDNIRKIKHRLQGKKLEEEKSYVFQFAKIREEIKRMNRFIVGSFSFGLLMFCIGLCLTLAYLLW